MTHNYTWNPIDTAPTDNKRPLYLARFYEGELVELDFDGSWEYWQESWEMAHINGYYWVSANGIEEPTHWAYQDGPPPIGIAKVHIPPPGVGSEEVMYAEGWNACCEAYFGGAEPPPALVITTEVSVHSLTDDVNKLLEAARSGSNEAALKLSTMFFITVEHHPVCVYAKLPGWGLGYRLLGHDPFYESTETQTREDACRIAIIRAITTIQNTPK